MKTCVHGPTDYSKMLKPIFRVEDQDPPERTKRHTRGREEVEEDAQM